jgi:hypothetical protein
MITPTLGGVYFCEGKVGGGLQGFEIRSLENRILIMF